MAFTDLSMLKNSFIPGWKSTQSWCMIYFVWLNSIYMHLSRKLVCDLFREIDLVFFFLGSPYLVLVLGWYWVHRMMLVMFLPCLLLVWLAEHLWCSFKLWWAWAKVFPVWGFYFSGAYNYSFNHTPHYRSVLN